MTDNGMWEVMVRGRWEQSSSWSLRMCEGLKLINHLKHKGWCEPLLSFLFISWLKFLRWSLEVSMLWVHFSSL